MKSSAAWLPASVSFLYFFATGPHRGEVVPLVFLGIWLLHYGNRGFYFPLSIRSPRGARASFSLMVIATGWFVTATHGYLHAAFFTTHATHYTLAWLSDPRFLNGLPIYLISLALNIQSDAIVRGLRSLNEVAMGERVYRIPRGGLFRWVTSPSYLTELTAWAGLALSTWSLAGVFIFAVSAANLVPGIGWYLGHSFGILASFGIAFGVGVLCVAGVIFGSISNASTSPHPPLLTPTPWLCGHSWHKKMP